MKRTERKPKLTYKKKHLFGKTNKMTYNFHSNTYHTQKYKVGSGGNLPFSRSFYTHQCHELTAMNKMRGSKNIHMEHSYVNFQLSGCSDFTVAPDDDAQLPF